jgi:hypothetical protein
MYTRILQKYACCDPLSLNCSKRTYLRNVSPHIAEKASSIRRKPIDCTMKICTSCYIKVSAKIERFSRERSITPEMNGEFYNREELITPAVFFNVEKFNIFLVEVGKETIDTTKLCASLAYKQQKFAEISEFLKKEVFEISSVDVDGNQCSDCENLIGQLKTKFDTATTNVEKIRLLTVLPPSWTYPSITSEFGASRRMIQLAKSTAALKGICSDPDQKLKKQYSPEKKNAIVRFFQSPEISYVMPGKKAK